MSGFTLLEILIVVIVLAILSTIVALNLNSMSDQTRTTVRRADINSIKKALEHYRAYAGTYPDSLAELTLPLTVPNTDPPETKGPFLNELSVDPTDGNPFSYIKISDSCYQLEGETTGG